MYSVVIPCRNGEKTIAKTLTSLLNQSIKPKEIIVVDDASTDDTPNILASFKVKVVRLEHNYPRNFNRVPKLVNIGINKLNPKPEYLMLSGDDSVYPRNYAQVLVQKFKDDPSLKIASGNMRELKYPSQAPQGSGRIIEYKWLTKHLPFPTSSTWESGIMFKALAEGMTVKCFNEVTFSHKRQYSAYSIRTFGHAMHSLGYIPLFVMLRLVKIFIRAEHPRRYILYELLGYVEYYLASPEKVDEIKRQVRQDQWARLNQLVQAKLGLSLLWDSLPMLKDILIWRLQRKLRLHSKPDYLSIALTWKCNSRCSTCGIWNAPHSNREMTLEDYERLLRDPLLSNLKVWEMTGGEPTLYKDIRELTHLAFELLPKKTQVRIGTNCIAVNQLIDLIDEFKDKPLFLALSIDGISQKHDEIRGVKGNFHKVVKVIRHIRRLQRQGSPIQFGASVCVSKLNIDHVPKLTNWLERNHIPFQLTPVIFPPYARIEYAREERDNLDFISPTERAKAIELFSRYHKLTYELFRLYWAKKKYPIPACYALQKYIHITPDGDCEVCMWRPVVVGNLTKNTFSEIWKGKKTAERREKIRDCTICAHVHPNLCDALDNYHFHGTLVSRYLINVIRKRLWRF